MLSIYYVLAKLLTLKFKANVILCDYIHYKSDLVILIAKGSLLIF